MKPPLHVVAGVLEDDGGRVLVAERAAGTHHAGTWEFPGGKCEHAEAPFAALCRELDEELGIRVQAAEPLIRVPWPYSARTVDLDVWRVTRWHGTPHGREGQGVQWLDAAALRAIPMPPADRPVVAALQLPRRMAITPEHEAPAACLATLERALQGGIRLVQLRRPDLGPELLPLAHAVRALTQRYGATLIVNGDTDLAAAVGADGSHVSAARARALQSRPVPTSAWFGVSCHDSAELAVALALGADYVVVGSVHATPSHPDRLPLGWSRFAELARAQPLPVYAIGGVTPDDLETARAHGAFGVAGIRSFGRE